MDGPGTSSRHAGLRGPRPSPRSEPRGRWTFTEADGHALETFDSDGGSMSFEVLGAYGVPLPTMKQGSWVIDDLHGVDVDDSKPPHAHGRSTRAAARWPVDAARAAAVPGHDERVCALTRREGPARCPRWLEARRRMRRTRQPHRLAAEEVGDVHARRGGLDAGRRNCVASWRWNHAPRAPRPDRSFARWGCALSRR